MKSQEVSQYTDVSGGTHSLIRRFTDEVINDEPDNTLVQSLKHVVDEKDKELELVQPWRSQYDGPITVNPETADLDFQCEVVDKQWKVFKQQMQDEQQAELEKRSKWHLKKRPAKQLEVEGKPKPTANDVIEAVKDAEKIWKEKERLGQGRVQGIFHAFCRVLDRHKSMLEMLPSQNEYFSILCGAITTLISASSNHQRTAKGLGKALMDITTDLDLCIDTVKLMYVDDMKEAISDLYLHIFHFLNSALKWFQSSSWRKVMNSLNEDFYSRFEDQLSKIKRMSSLLLQKSALKSQYEIRDMRLVLEQEAERNHQERTAAREERLRDQTWRKEVGRALSHLLVGHSMYETAESNVEAWRYEKESRKVSDNGMKARTLSIEYEGLEVRKERSRPLRKYQKARLEQWSRHLDGYTSNVQDLLEEIIPSSESVDRDVVQQLQEWGASTSSQSLWVVGTFENHHPSSTTAIATKVVTTAQTLQIPVVCFMCSPPRPCSHDDDLARATVIDLLYSLIRQLIYLVPADFETTASLAKPRFAKLDGGTQSFDTALGLLETLIIFAPKTLLIVIDGLEQLDDSVAAEDAEEILGILQDNVASSVTGKDRRLLKTLYTSAGSCVILENLDEDILTTIEARRGPPKRRRKRGVRLVDLDLSDMEG